MSKTLLVALREVKENLRTKAFWIGILSFPLILGMAVTIPLVLEMTTSPRHYAVVDHSGWLLEAVERDAAVPDLKRILQLSLEAVRQGGETLTQLPPALRRTGEQLDRLLGGASAEDCATSRLEELMIEALARAAAGTGPQGKTIQRLRGDDTATDLAHLEQEVRSWWTALPPEEQAQLGTDGNQRYQRVEVPGSGDELITELNRRVANGDLFAYFVIGDNPLQGDDGCRYVSTNLTDDDLRLWFERLATAVVRDRRLAREEIDPETASWLQAPLRFSGSRVAAGGAVTAVELGDQVRQWAPVAFVYLLWIAVFTVAQMLLTNTIEEKSNRIIEVLLSSLSPLQLMTGKIIGIAATGLTVVSSWVLFFSLGAIALPRLLGAEADLDLGVIATDPVFVGAFVVYFLLGYLLYASLLVGIGSVCNTLKEAQNLMTPVMVCLMVPLLCMIPIGRDPDGILARVLSFIPPFTPFVMMNRAAAPPTATEYLLTTLLLVVTIAAVMWGAAKVFRVGVLMTGKPPRPGEILRWLRAPVGQVPARRGLEDGTR